MRDLLFLAHRAPYPPNRGDKIRSHNVLKYLAARARVHLVAFADEIADRDPPHEVRALCASITIVPRTKSRGRAALAALLTGQPVSLTAFADLAVAKAVVALGDMPTYVFSGQMAQYVAAPNVMDFVDLDSAKFGALAEGARGTMRWLMRREARLLERFERHVAERARATTFVSAAEAALFDGPCTVVVENGIDTAFFDPAAAFARLAPDAAPLIVFTGQMDYRPNIDAVTAFAERALPAIRRRFATARFAIVGRAPTAAVRALAGEGVTVTGPVDDVRPWLAAADVCVAPLSLARGVQNKVLEAMAMARPVVASSAAFEGIDAVPGRDLLVADGTEATAAAVLGLISDPAAAARIGTAARARMCERYAWERQLAPLEAIVFG